MSCKLNNHQFQMLREALECDLRQLIKFHDEAISASLAAFEKSAKDEAQRDAALQVSACADVLEELFFARFPAAARELFPNHGQS